MIDRLAKRLGYEKRSFTDGQLRYLLAQSEGLVAGISAAEEIAAGIIGRAFASAEVTNELLDPETMLQIGRDLMLAGESVWRVQVRPRPLEWQNSYELKNGAYTFPDGVSAAPSVLHVRYAWDRITGRGQAPLDGAPGLRDMARQILHGLEKESRAKSGYLLPVPVDKEAADGLRQDLKEMDGRIATIETGKGGFGDPQNKTDYKQVRVGFDASAGAAQMFLHSQNLALVALGIPTELAFERSDGTATREAWRRCLHGTIQPLGRLVETAAARAGVPVKISFDALMASDISGRARAFGSLVNGGMDIPDAQAVAGILLD